jgi:hypothetical protein
MHAKKFEIFIKKTLGSLIKPLLNLMNILPIQWVETHQALWVAQFKDL